MNVEIEELVSKVQSWKEITEREKILINLVEALYKEVLQLRKENQELKDENRRLKGTNPKSYIKPKSSSNNSSNYPNRNSNDMHKSWNKSEKKKDIKIDKEVTCTVDKNKLPKDAVFKGTREIRENE